MIKKIKYINTGWNKYGQCSKCGTVNRRHYGKGLCKKCYYRDFPVSKKSKSYRLEWQRLNKKKVKEYGNKYKETHPWHQSYRAAKERCLPQKPYGIKGIKFMMAIEDFKFLWLRDKANLMKRPSIDRIDNNGNYELENCRFIEMSINRVRSRLGGWAKHGSCKQCSRNDRPYGNLGLCRHCYCKSRGWK